MISALVSLSQGRCARPPPAGPERGICGRGPLTPTAALYRSQRSAAAVSRPRPLPQRLRLTRGPS